MRTRETLQPQIFRLQKSFQINDAENNGKGISKQQNSRKEGSEKNDNSRNLEHRHSNTIGPLHHSIEAEDYLDDDDDYYLAELHDCDPSDARNKVHVVKLLAQMMSKGTGTVDQQHEIPVIAHLDAEKKTPVHSNDMLDIFLQMQLNTPEELPTNFGIPTKVSSSPTALDKYDADNHVTVKSLSKMKEKEKDKEMNDGGDEINVTRIIVGNFDSFIDRYPYFMDKVNGWVKVSQPD